MSNKDWTSKLRDQMTDYQEPVKHDLWAGIAQSLAQNQPVAGENRVPENHPVKRVEKEPKARVVTLKRWSAAAAAVALLGIGGSYVYLHQEDVEQGNAQLASLASSEASSASSVASSSLSAASSSHSKQVPLLAADNKSADSKSRQKAASSAASLLSSDYASVPVQSAAPMNDEGETMVAVASDEAPLVASKYKSAESAQSQAEPNSSSSYHFSRNSEVAGVSMKLYAENLGAGMGNVNSGSNIVNRYSDSGVMADPMPGVYPDPSVGGSNDVDYLMAAAYKALQKSPQGKAKHHVPVSVGMQIAFGVAPRLSLSTGVVYTRTSSDFYPYAPNNDYNVHQVLHYVGIPVGLNYELWRSGGFHAYVMAGAEAAYNVKNDTDEDGTRKQDAKRDRVQFSGKASLGAQYDISPSVGLYIEPGAKYYFDNGSDIENTFKDKKLNFNLQFGLRFNL
ncbi:outer membrane beta-barrel protein [Segatella copri]|uniref:outer membrane beta-barrel protein n=1 Tax=Segatella copri TaxID=165179 RepID=UPI0019333042|nr:outer membrane beta-barrel protein [Segatella copri]MBM0145146.1 PorT family protein [Segatella copri]